MSDIIPGVSLGILCFPDITGATLSIWGTVSFGYGLNYTTGGIPFGLVKLADSLTVNFNGFLQGTVYDEAPAAPSHPYTFRYVPSTDSLQIFDAGVEVANGATIPPALFNDSSVLFQAVFNRTEMLG